MSTCENCENFRALAKERAEQESLLAARNVQNAAAFTASDALREYARRMEDRFVALAGTVSDAEEDRARKEIAAERAVCFPLLAGDDMGRKL